MNLSLKNKNALVCGSSQGIGFAAAKELALLGANCILLARNRQSLEKAVAQLDTSFGQKHQVLVGDFSDVNAVQSSVEALVQHTMIHILVNNSGGPAAGMIWNAAAQDFLNGLNQHLINNHHLVKAVLPGMMQAQYGRIINVISTSVKIPLKNLGVSNTVRHAVAGWAKSIANEIPSPHITVNNVLPGFTDTARLQSLIEQNAKNADMATEAMAAHMQEDVPLKRFGRPEEIGAVIAFLATPAAAYVHGASIPVDGGRTGSI